MTTAAVDTNALALGFVAQRSDSPPARLLEAWRSQRFILAVSEYILSELARTFAQPYFRRLITPEQAAENLQLLRLRAFVTPITVEVRGIASHPEDDPVIATAVSANAEYLVTGDGPLRRLGSYQGVTFVSPREFVDLVLSGPLD